MRKYTDITVLLDRSGSMESCKQAMESAFAEFVKGNKAIPSTRLTLIQFDSVDPLEVIYENIPVKNVGELALVPRGGTPLVDAFVRTIDRTGARLRDLRESERPNQVLFVVITDGQENSSREFKRRDVLDRVRKQQDSYNWKFIYLGANQDAIGEAATFGISRDMSCFFVAEDAQIASLGQTLSRTSSAYAMSGASPTFTDDDRVKMAAQQPKVKRAKGLTNS